MSPTQRRLDQCQQIIGYHFSNPDLLDTALTHSSLRAPDRECNERLEFLGDSVLGLVVTEELYHLLPDQSEGELTRIKSAVVSRSALLSTSQELGLQRFADFARGVGKRDKLPASVVANLVEAIIGAIYLDAGYYPAREFVLRHMGAALDDELNDRGAKNYKSLLQHEVQQSVGVTPTYRTIDAEGPDHAKEFVVAAIIRGQEWGQASGPTKKDAEQDAARLALEAWERRGRGRRRRRKRKSDATSEEVAAVESTDAVADEVPAEEVPFSEPEIAQPETAKPEPVEAPAEESSSASDEGHGDADPAVTEEIETRLRRRKKRTRRRRRPSVEEDLAAADAAAIAAESAAEAPAPEPAEAPETPKVEERPRRERRRSRRAPKPEPVQSAGPEQGSASDAEPVEGAEALEAPAPEPEETPSAFAAGIDVPSKKRTRPKRKKRARKKAPADEAPAVETPAEEAPAVDTPAEAVPAAGAPTPAPAPETKKRAPSAFASGIDVPSKKARPKRKQRATTKAPKVEAPARKRAPAPSKNEPKDEGGFASGI